MKLKHIFLAISLPAFLVSLTTVGSSLAYGVLKPLGAVFFILFFISHLTEKEAAKFDEEYNERMALAQRHGALAPESHQAERSSQPASGPRGLAAATH
jgi:hypothetical protein